MFIKSLVRFADGANRKRLEMFIKSLVRFADGANRKRLEMFILYNGH